MAEVALELVVGVRGDAQGPYVEDLGVEDGLGIGCDVCGQGIHQVLGLAAAGAYEKVGSTRYLFEDRASRGRTSPGSVPASPTSVAVFSPSSLLPPYAPSHEQRPGLACVCICSCGHTGPVSSQASARYHSINIVIIPRRDVVSQWLESRCYGCGAGNRKAAGAMYRRPAACYLTIKPLSTCSAS